MKLLTRIKQTLAAACLLGLAQFASAGVISFDLDTTLANVGDMFTVDLVWTGDPGEYLGDFDVDINYDASIVQYDGATIDPQMGIDSISCDFCGDFSVPGTIDIFAVSLDDAIVFPDLQDNQDSLGNGFVLATLEFTALAIGETALALSGVFGDEFGDPIDPALDNGRICVSAAGTPAACPVSAVPEPSTLPLALLALLPGILGLRRKRNA